MVSDACSEGSKEMAAPPEVLERSANSAFVNDTLCVMERRGDPSYPEEAPLDVHSAFDVRNDTEEREGRCLVQWMKVELNTEK